MSAQEESSQHVSIHNLICILEIQVYFYQQNLTYELSYMFPLLFIVPFNSFDQFSYVYVFQLLVRLSSRCTHFILPHKKIKWLLEAALLKTLGSSCSTRYSYEFFLIKELKTGSVVVYRTLPV